MTVVIFLAGQVLVPYKITLLSNNLNDVCQNDLF